MTKGTHRRASRVSGGSFCRPDRVERVPAMKLFWYAMPELALLVPAYARATNTLLDKPASGTQTARRRCDSLKKSQSKRIEIAPDKLEELDKLEEMK